MSRKFGLKTLSASLLIAFSVSDATAASLGRMTVLSSLEQPLLAEIEVAGVAPGEASTMVARLASPADYRQAGLEVSETLQSMHFVVESKGGRSFIKISSSKVINEPLIDLLLELRSANGRMIREYNFLLDPPAPPVVAPTVSAPVAPERIEAEPAKAVSTPAPAAVPISTLAPASAPAPGAALLAAKTAAPVEASPAAKDAAPAGAAMEAQTSKPQAEVKLPLASASELPPLAVVAAPASLASPAVVVAAAAAHAVPAAAPIEKTAGAPASKANADGETKQLAVAARPGDQIETLPVPDRSSAVSPTPQSARAQASGSAYHVKQGDSLLRIVARLKTPSVSRDQMLLALYSNNQAAFVSGNINRLRAGSSLSVPSVDAALAIDRNQAHKVVLAKMKNFAEYQHRVAADVAAAAPVAPGSVAEPVATAPIKQKPAEDVKHDAEAGLGKKDALKLSRSKKGVDLADEIAHEKAMAESKGRVKQLEGYVKDLTTLVNLQNKKLSEQQH